MFKVKLGDLELLPLIKYENMFGKYRNISVWSSPEVLKSPKKLLAPTTQMDIYSYGMLLWELVHMALPFDNDLTMAIKYIIEEDCRPMIVSEDGGLCDKEMAQLIRLCWQTTPEDRPNFLLICQSLFKSMISNRRVS